MTRGSHDLIAGSRVLRVTRRPHEVRVHLTRDAGTPAWLRFWPADGAEVDVPLPGATIRRTTVEESSGRARVRLWAADGLVLDARSERWDLHPYDGEQACLWSLAQDEKAAVERAVVAVVERDAGTVATLLPPGHGPVADVWTWVDDTGLLVPPPPFDDWDGSVLSVPGGKAVHIELLDAADPHRPTDLTLELELTRAADGRPQVRIDDLHAM